MPDIINLLPDSVANQIAAGEVIQRPASAVKELLENSIDSGADDIKLVIKDAGKALIQVIDNGCGMSETDARMCFERHATSKIKEANDLFAIQTLGFRGEAMASIAAIARVELKSKRVEDEIGTQILIEGSTVVSQEPGAGNNGTSISVKNLFYNIPARRKFLKSNNTELRHIIEEFHRVALVHPEIKFSFFNDNRQLFVLQSANLKQRIVALYGNTYNNKLVPVEQSSDIVSISGFIGKPEFARKTRGEQYFFTNGRFIKHPYLNHAVDAAFKELIPNEAHPSYFLYFKIDPKEIDINIHPTKTEINFQNNQVIYAMLSSAVKQALGKFNITPSLDFDTQHSFEISQPPSNANFQAPTVKVNPDYNPFEAQQAPRQGGSGNFPANNYKRTDNWEKLYKTDDIKIESESSTHSQQSMDDENESFGEEKSENAILLQKRYIITKVRSGLMLINRQRAIERILYEEFLQSFESGKGSSQQMLFPETIQFTAADAEILKTLLTELKTLGFDIEYFGSNSYIINGTPSILNNTEVKDVLDNMIENVKKNQDAAIIDKKVNLARSMAVNMAFRHNTELGPEEIKSLINRLFSTKAPEISPDGKPVVRIVSMEELDQKF
ncbi:DNA mismatch repair endonuclease MutL [Desulfosarcina sp.]|nr:DNA mismatch repair endonuclease MutL [Desulfosarcina sp.]